MTEAERINQEATIDARDNFKAIDEKLEELKNKVHNLHLKDPDHLVEAIALVSGGFFMGSKGRMPLRWLLHFLSGGVFAYTGLRLLLNLTDKRKAAKKTVPVSIKTVSQVKVPVSPEHSIEAPEKKHLENVRIIEPTT